ncbi:MAG: DUF547 domain-containing protein [Myxococcota bacterium]|nr:DUF547 domain-containing protein [Myxococcota bacterium]
MAKIIRYLVSMVLTVGCVTDGFEAPSDTIADEFARTAENYKKAGPFEPAQLTTLVTVDHSHLDVILRSFVDTNRGRYGALHFDREARRLLDDYKVLLEGVRPESLKVPAERIAFWLNAYTALVVEGLGALVAKHGDAAEISQDDFGIFTAKKHSVAGFALTLEEIEHLVLRGDRHYPDVIDTPASLAEDLIDQHRLLFPDGQLDARVNFAISFGARGFPAMPNRAYRAETLDAVLETRTKQYINDPVVGANERGVSVLFDWFQRDFVLSNGSVRGFIKAYLDDPDGTIDPTRTLRFSWVVQ